MRAQTHGPHCNQGQRLHFLFFKVTPFAGVRKKDRTVPGILPASSCLNVELRERETSICVLLMGKLRLRGGGMSEWMKR